MLKALHNDELYHVIYLEEKLKQFKKEGIIVQDEMKSTVPSKADIAKEISKFRSNMAERDLGDKKKMLSKILKVEIETSQFYRDMVDKERGRNNFHNYASRLQGIFVRSQIQKTLK